jgi:sec-independent protein translocase protein TatA
VSVGPFQILIIALVFLVLFGRGRISEMMGDLGKGVNSFKKGLVDDQTLGTASLEGLQGDAAAPQPASDKISG